MSDYRVLVTGSRDWRDRKAVFDALDAAFAKYAYRAKLDNDPDWRIVVVHGDCPTGADRWARMWYESRKSMWHERVDEDPHPADWARLGKAAGGARNQVMADKGAVECLSFYWYGAGNSGTADCVARADAAGIPVTRIYGNGTEWTRTILPKCPARTRCLHSTARSRGGSGRGGGSPAGGVTAGPAR